MLVPTAVRPRQFHFCIHTDREPLRINCEAGRASSAAVAPRSNKKHVVVIGAGIGGICIAGRLARRGFEVTVCESNDKAGGRAASQSFEGCRFDTGPSLLLFPNVYRQAFEALGARMEDEVKMKQVTPAAYRVHFEGTAAGLPWSTLDLLNDESAMSAQLEAEEPGAGAQYKKFLRQARAALRMGFPNFIEKDFTTLSDVLRLPGLLPQLRGMSIPQLLEPYERMLKRYFKDWRLRGLFSFQNLYVGLSPSSAPGVFSLLAGTELTDGVFYPLGGFGQVVKGLLSAAERCGARFRYGAPVAAIETEGAHVTGVRLSSGEVVPASIVVSNRDLAASYELLEGGECREYAARRAPKLTAMEHSAGIISFCWAVRGRVPQLLHHNVFLSDQGEQAWIRAADSSQLLRHPNFYVHCPSRTDPSAASDRCDSIMVLLPVANMQESGTAEYRDLVTAGRKAILGSFAAAGVELTEETIVMETVTTPPQWQQLYGLEHGAAFGMSHGLNQLAAFRPSIRDKQVQGLYFVGASTRPGNGVPLCMISAALAEELIWTDFQRSH